MIVRSRALVVLFSMFLMSHVLAVPAGASNTTHGRAASMADSIARDWASRSFGARVAAIQRLKRELDSNLVVARADTLGAEVLLAVQDYRSQRIALRLISGRESRDVLDAIVPADASGGRARAPAEPHLLERVVLGRLRVRDARGPQLAALLWFAETGGSTTPHTLWFARLSPDVAGADAIHRLPVHQVSREVEDGLEVLRKYDEILVRTFSDQSGSSTFDAWRCGVCTHLVMVTDWRVQERDATELRSAPRDDAAFAVARAFDSKHHYEHWPAEDVEMSERVERWLAEHAAVSLEFAIPRGVDVTDVKLWSGGPRDTVKVAERAPADTIRIEVTRRASESRIRWSLR